LCLIANYNERELRHLIFNHFVYPYDLITLVNLLGADELLYNAFYVAKKLYGENLTPHDTRLYDSSIWGTATMPDDVWRMSSRCLEAIHILRYPIKERVEDMVLPTQFGELAIYSPSPDLKVLDLLLITKMSSDGNAGRSAF